MILPLSEAARLADKGAQSLRWFADTGCQLAAPIDWTVTSVEADVASWRSHTGVEQFCTYDGIRMLVRKGYVSENPDTDEETFTASFVDVFEEPCLPWEAHGVAISFDKVKAKRKRSAAAS